MKTIYSFSFVLIFLCNVSFANILNSSLTSSEYSNEKFPIEQLDFYSDNNSYKIIVFTPSLSVKNEYAEMMTYALTNYFAKGYAFENKNIAGSNNLNNISLQNKIDVLLIVNDGIKPFYQSYENLKDLSIKYDPDGLYFEKLNVSKPEKINSSSVLYALNSDNEIIYFDNDYKGQGEHLKPLEYAIKKEMNGQSLPLLTVNNYLKSGDNAPQLKIDNEIYLSDYKGKKIVLTFYPAAFSGVLPEQNYSNPYPVMSCAVQLSSFDKIKPISSQIYHSELEDEVIYLAVSNSSPQLLKLWADYLKTENIKYVNDDDFSISMAYNSYNPSGFSTRSTFVIDREGVIKYISWDYNAEEEYVIQEELAKLD
ncbi:MAG: redoxin family protein [Ignavibacteria bacterium]|nr:redoxin family protein [Ignavibacteria bacterium]HCN36372.1 hypothetical protein [Bacteroidota bacterium]